MSAPTKVALVTGGNGGIGFELVRLLSEKGIKVYIGSRDAAKGTEAQEKLNAEGFKSVKSVQLEVTSIPSIEAARNTIEAAEGKLDILVNNAGGAKFNFQTNSLTVDIADIHEALEINFFGTINVTRVFAPLLKKVETPVILNVSSELGSNWYQAKPETTYQTLPYQASKAALNSFTVAVAQDFKKDGWKVNAVTPGYTSTKINFFKGEKQPRDGALSLLPYALLDKNGPTGKFFADDGKSEFPW